MSRFVQQDFNKKPEPKKDKPLPKFGGKEGNKDYSALHNNKKIPTKGGYQ